MKIQHLLFLSILVSIACLAKTIKCIDLSWHCPDAKYLQEHLPDIERTTPLDGLTIAFQGDPIEYNGETFVPKFWNAWANKPWTFDVFADFIARMQGLHFTTITDNFLYLTTNEADFDWLSDKDWKIVARNFGIAARVARESRMKGFLLDFEQYGIHFWEYKEAKGKPTFQQMEEVAFRRGQQWGRAVFKEFPDIILFLPYAFAFGKTNLSNAFLNGIFDVMPPKALLYEGDESNSYRARTHDQFQQLRRNLDKAIQNDTYPKNRSKARKQTRLAPGFYMDALFPKDGAPAGRVQMVCDCIREAAAVADTYIWFYGEKRCWWRNSMNKKYQEIWDDAPNAQGLTEAIRAVKKELKKKGN